MIPGTWVWVAWPPVIMVVAAVLVRRRAGLWHMLGVFALTTYAAWIASAAFFPIPTDRGPGFSIAAVNLVPLRELIRSFDYLGQGQIIRQHGGNFLLLVPFALIGPALWPRLRAWRWALAIGVGASVLIELGQLAISTSVGYYYRSTDIDDVILNTAGALLGYALFLGARRATRAWRRGMTESPATSQAPREGRRPPR